MFNLKLKCQWKKIKINMEYGTNTTLILINLTLREYEVAHTLLITSFLN